jgi:hypothetical protein
MCFFMNSFIREMPTFYKDIQEQEACAPGNLRERTATLHKVSNGQTPNGQLSGQLVATKFLQLGPLTKDRLVVIVAGKVEVKRNDVPGRQVLLPRSCSRCHASNGTILI